MNGVGGGGGERDTENVLAVVDFKHTSSKRFHLQWVTGCATLHGLLAVSSKRLVGD